MKLARLSFTSLTLLLSFSMPAEAMGDAAATRVQQERGDAKGSDAKDKKAEKAKRDAAAKDAAKTLRKGMKAKEPNARRAALTEASGVDHPTVVDEMARGLKDDDLEVRRTTLRLFGTMQSDDALVRLEKFARSQKRALKDDTETQVTLIKAIARHRDPETLDWLMRGALDETEYDLRRARVYSAAYQRTPEALDAIFEAMNKCDAKRLRSRMRELRTALVWLTGQDLGADPANWSAWWRTNGESFEIKATPPKLSGQNKQAWNSFWGNAREYDRRKKRGDRGG